MPGGLHAMLCYAFLVTFNLSLVACSYIYLRSFCVFLFVADGSVVLWHLSL